MAATLGLGREPEALLEKARRRDCLWRGQVLGARGVPGGMCAQCQRLGLDPAVA